MKVKQLIKELQKLNQDLPVYIDLMEGAHDIENEFYGINVGGCNGIPCVWITPGQLVPNSSKRVSIVHRY